MLSVLPLLFRSCRKIMLKSCSVCAKNEWMTADSCCVLVNMWQKAWVKGKATHLPATPTTWVKGKGHTYHMSERQGPHTYQPHPPHERKAGPHTYQPHLPHEWKARATHLPATPTTWVKGKGHTPTSHTHHMSERQGPHPPHEWKARATHLPATLTTWVKGRATHLPATLTTWVKGKGHTHHMSERQGPHTYQPRPPHEWKARATPTTWVKGKGHTPTSHNHHMSERQGHAPTSNKCFVATNVFVMTNVLWQTFLLWQNTSLVATDVILSQQNFFARNIFCCGKTFLATNICHDSFFFTTSLLLSRHTHVCRDKTRLLSRWNTSSVKHVFVVTKKRYLRQLPPVVSATPTSHKPLISKQCSNQTRHAQCWGSPWRADGK